MRYLFIAFDFKPATGGIADYIHNLAFHLQLSGDEVTILAPFIAGTNCSDFDQKQPYTIIRFPIIPYKILNFVPRHLFYAGLLSRTIKEVKPDCVFFGNWNSYVPTLQLVCFLHKIPCFLFVYGMEINNRNLFFINRALQKISFETVSYIISISGFTKTLCQKKGIKEEKIFIVQPGVNPEKFRPQIPKIEARRRLDIPLNQKMILSVGRLIERKGFDKAIQSVALLQRDIDNFVYIIIGDGPQKEYLMTLVNKLNLGEKVIFKGNVTDEEKILYYYSADVFLMPNRELPDGDVEGFGIVFLEANLCGIPVIAGNSGGAVEAVEHNKSGILVDGNDVQSIYKALQTLLLNDRLAQNMGLDGKKRVENEFLWTCKVKQFREVLTQILKPQK